MLRMRNGKSFCPSEVVRWIYPCSWKYFMSDVQAEMMKLYREDKIAVTQKGELISKDEIPSGPIRISKAGETL
jgi:hypothetical protein